MEAKIHTSLILRISPEQFIVFQTKGMLVLFDTTDSYLRFSAFNMWKTHGDMLTEPELFPDENT